MRAFSRYGALTSAIAVVVLGLSQAAFAAETDSLVARGGRLYDKWYGENKAEKPGDNHPAYANKAGEYGSADSWRCKECHGWDYKGKDGAYGKGKHETGIAGIAGAAGKDPAALAASFRAAPHSYTDKQLSDDDLQALALFVSAGQIDMSKYLDADGKPKGDGTKGEAYFNTLCAGCHGLEGHFVAKRHLGKVSRDDPWHSLHNMLNGHPDDAMPALREIDPKVTSDILAHIQTLPERR